MSRSPEVVGVREIADLTGMHPQTVKGWRARGLLPDPLPGTVSGAPAWLREDIEKWFRDNRPKSGRPTKGT